MPSLFVILARERNTAIIIRRGPSKWYHLIRWDTNDDVFEHGAWIKGRIYEEKCDLSPDCRYFLYFFLPGTRIDDPTLGTCWTAISRAPWMYALTLWPENTTYGGGGRFIDNFNVSLGGYRTMPHPNFPQGRIQLQDCPAPLHESSGEIPGSDWCGRDQQDRLIYTRGGKLYRVEDKSEKLVADFSDLTPNPQEAPDWAKEPI